MQNENSNNLYSKDLAPIPQSKRSWGHMELCRFVDFNEPLYPDIYARFVAHRRRYELVSSHFYHLFG